MLELIQNLDWVLKTTLVLWVFTILLRCGLGTLITSSWTALTALLPMVGVATGILMSITAVLFSIVKWVFTIWSAFILLGYIF